MEPADKIALIRRLATEMHRTLATAPADTLTGPTACSEWDVGTVVAHLTGGAMRQRDSMRRGRDGQGGPPEGVAGVTTPDQVQQRNALTNRQFRDELGETLLDRFRDEYAALDDLLQGWTDWTIGCWHQRRGTMLAASYLDLRIQELVIHDWDIRSGGAGQTAMDADGVIALLPGSEMWYDLCFRPTAHLPQPVVYRFDVGGGAEGARLRHNVIVSGDRFTVDNSDNAPAADLTITCTAEIYLLCLYGRVEWVAAKQDGRITVVSHSNEQHGPEREETVHTDSLIRFREWFGGL
jgi:uncharacterized protein (TIGR03083 family)